MKCCTCQKNKLETDFSFRNKQLNLRNSKCKKCHKKYVDKHYQNNKKDYIERAKRDKSKEMEKNKSLLAYLKIECKHCGEKHPATLDFHHLDMTTKEKNISQMTSRKKIISESKKCIVLCSNCHRKLHYEDRLCNKSIVRSVIHALLIGVPDQIRTDT